MTFLTSVSTRSDHPDWLDMKSLMPSCAINIDGDILFCNPAFQRLYQNQVPKNLLAQLPLEDAESFRLHVTSSVLNREAGQSFEVRLVCGETVELWMQTFLTCLAEPELRQSPRILVQFSNIDQLKRREMHLGQLESRWDAALVSSGLGVWDHDYRVGKFFYSDTWKLMRGLPMDEEINAETDNWILSVHPDDRAMVLEEIRKQGDGDSPSSLFEYRERHTDGHWVWIECRGACVEWDDQGKPLRVIGTDTDVTARKEAEAEMVRMTQRLELALDVSKIGVFESSLADNKITWDERLRVMYGVERAPDTADSLVWENTLHPEDREKALERVNLNLKSGQSFSNQFRIIRGDGEIRHIRARVAMFTDAQGQETVVGANWDVTDDILLQQELERAKTLAEARNRELEASRAMIEHNALHDYLTNLPNRRYLDDMLLTRAREASQTGSGLAVLHIDLDRFKQINDTLGHKAGDHMLQHAASVLLQTTSSADFVARIGGDEFVILSDLGGSAYKLSRLCDTLIQNLCKPVNLNGHLCRIGASIGIAASTDAHIDAKELLLKSDIALYRAKSRGRNRFEFFSQDDQTRMINTKLISDDILTGLEKNQFIPFYQLQFDAATLNVSGVESLARWHHPVHGILTPDRFLSIAEDLDVVTTIDSLILERAIADFGRWEQLGLNIPKVSVNVSSRRLDDPELGQKLKALKFKPGTVSFELLETIFLDDYDEVVDGNLEAMRKLGIHIEIDDFGTGHASIVSLLKINPTTLKIDRALIKSIPQSSEQRKLVHSIIEIGKSLNIKVVAEGVESEAHIRILQELGCDVLQGYALAKPMSFDDLNSYVARQAWR